MHKRRKMAYPPTAGILEKQSFKFIENGVALTPYEVETQTFEVELPKISKLMGMTKHADTTHEDNKIQYAGTQKNTEPLAWQ